MSFSNRKMKNPSQADEFRQLFVPESADREGLVPPDITGASGQ